MIIMISEKLWVIVRTLKIIVSIWIANVGQRNIDSSNENIYSIDMLDKFLNLA